ncbi:hypothetical protein SSX86_016926 [Deinandra increscens subsp. villosa]|uniref:Uncharacterized protein n=1 Tax=Deinandra increscens subsp. villosa TaxID=3103831 RepID=A0AAP0CU51_9ASTR
MESDLPLIAITEEDDSLLQQFPDLDQTSSESSINYSTFSPFALPPSHAKSVKDGVHMEKPISSSSEAINNKENINSNGVEVPKLGMEPMQMKRKKKGGGYNLRKSLAWDRAFFTDEGILDPLELTLITGIDARACRGGLPTISEEGNSSISSDVRCTDESGEMEASEDAPLKEIRDKNRTTKENIEKTGCSMRNRGFLLHNKVTHKVLSSNHTNRGWSKVGGCSEPLAASSYPFSNSNTLKTAKKESKLPKIPISKPGPSFYGTTKGSMAASQLRHNLIPKQTTSVEKNFGLKSSLQNAHGSQSKAKTGSGNLHLPVKELAQRTIKNLVRTLHKGSLNPLETHSSKAASSTRSQLVHRVQVDRANSRSEMVQDTLQACKVLEESLPLAAKHLTQHAAANSNNSLHEADKLTSLGSYHIQRASKGLITSDRLHPCESQECPAALARPSGLRLPSPSLHLFDQGTVLESGSLQQRKIQQYMGSDRKIGELLPPARPPMKSNGITENICRAVRNSSKECCAPSIQLCPSSNNMLNTSIKGDPDSNIHQTLITKVVPRVDIKLEYECMGSKQEKRIFGQEEIAAARNGEEGIKVSSSTEQVDGDVGTCRQLLSEGRDPETKYKSMLHNKEDGLQRYTAFSISTSGQSTQHQEENISTRVDDLAQTSWKQADTEISDDAASKVNPLFHLDAGSQVCMKSQEQDEVRKGDDVGTTKCVAPGIENYSVVLQHGTENDVSKVVDDRSLRMEEKPSPCSRADSITFGNSHSLEDVIELKGIDTFCIPFQNLNTEQRNDGLDAFPTATTTSPRVRDPSSEEGNNIHTSPAPSIRSKAQLHDNPVRDTVTQFLDDNPSAEDFHIEPTTSIQKKYQLPITPLLHDSPLSTDGFHFMPTTSIMNKSQLQDSDVANRSPKYFEATTPCISVSLNPRLSVGCRIPEESSCLEEGTFPNVTDTNDQLSQEKCVSSATRIEAPGSKQDGVDVDLSPGEVVSLIDDHYQSNDLSHLRPQVEVISDTASLGDDSLVKRESVLQGTECTNTYQQSFEEERVDIAAQTVEAQLKIPKENHKSQKLGIIVAEKSQDSRGNILEAKPAVQGSTGGLKTNSLFQSENQTLEGSGPISSISKTSVEDGLVQLLDGDVLVQSCSRLKSEVQIPSIENADHRDVHGKQAGFSNFGIKLERASKSNEYLQQVSVCKVNWNVVEGGDIYECDSRPSVNVALSVVEEAGNIDRQQCVGYRTPGSIVMESSEHNESYSDGQTAECGDLTLTLDSRLELEPSVEDKMFVKNSTCMEYCSAVKSCSFLSDSMPEEKTTLFLEDQELTKDSLLSTEKILDSVIVSPEENTNASAQILPMVIVNGDDQPQGFVGTTSSVETCDYFTNGKSSSSLSVSQQLTTDVESTSAPELCCLVGLGDESLLTKTTHMIGSEGSKSSTEEQVVATPLVVEFQHEDSKDNKVMADLIKRSNSIKMQDNSLSIHPPNAVPFSDEWLAAFEAAGEEILTMKCGAVQHSPQDKSLPEPSPWSPVKKKAIQIGPYDCTKYTNANSQL